MAVTTDTFFGNRGTIAVIGASATSPTSTTVMAVVKGVEINITYEHVELYGFGTITRADVAKHTSKVEVKINWAKFDPQISTSTFWPYWVIDPAGSTTPSPVLAAANARDTNVVKLFQVTARWIGTGGKIMNIVVPDVYFESVPIPMPENDFVVMNMSGYGSTFTITDS